MGFWDLWPFGPSRFLDSTNPKGIPAVGANTMRLANTLGRNQSTPLVLRPTEVASGVAGVLALLWYPFTHLYGYHSALGHLPRFMDHIFGLLTILGLAFLVLMFLLASGRRLASTSAYAVLLFWLFLGLTLGWVLVHFALGRRLVSSFDLLFYYGRALLYYSLLFMVGFYLRVERWRWVWAVAFVALLMNSLAFVRWDRLMIDLRSVAPQFRGIYLQLATTALFTGVATWASLRRRALRTAVLLAMLPLLLFMGARAEFAAFLLVFPIALWLTLRPGRQLAVYLLGGVAVIGALLVFGTDALLASRHAQFLSLDEMTSLIARGRVMDLGLQQIAASPVLGDYGGTLAAGRGIAGYIHNLLSVWQAFGLLPFLLYTGLLGYCNVTCIGLIFQRGRTMSREAQLVIVWVFLATILTVAAKSFGWPHVALAWGATAGLLARTGRSHHAKENGESRTRGSSCCNAAPE